MTTPQPHEVLPPQASASSEQSSERRRAKSFGQASRCPHCGGTKVQRLHRNWAERLYSKLSDTYPHICELCVRRFYAMIQN